MFAWYSPGHPRKPALTNFRAAYRRATTDGPFSGTQRREIIRACASWKRWKSVLQTSTDRHLHSLYSWTIQRWPTNTATFAVLVYDGWNCTSYRLNVSTIVLYARIYAEVGGWTNETETEAHLESKSETKRNGCSFPRSSNAGGSAQLYKTEARMRKKKKKEKWTENGRKRSRVKELEA